MVHWAVGVVLAVAVWAAVGSAVDCLEEEAWAGEAVEAVGMGAVVGAVVVLEVVAMAWAARAVMVDPAALQSSRACMEVADAAEEETALGGWAVRLEETAGPRWAESTAGAV
jgi:hypothetical protein